MDKTILEGLVKGLITMFGFPALAMVIWNWQFGDITIINYWQFFWIRIIVYFLFYVEKEQ